MAEAVRVSEPALIDSEAHPSQDTYVSFGSQRAGPNY